VNPTADDLPRTGRHLAALFVAQVVIAVAVITGTFDVLGEEPPLVATRPRHRTRCPALDEANRRS
jgi:hypothetical protein